MDPDLRGAFGASRSLNLFSLPESEMPDYSQGKIYCLRSPKTDKVYIGSTIVPLSKRLGQHKSTTNKCTSRHIVDAGDAFIELIEAFPCESREQLNKREGEIMRTMTNCINQKIMVQPQILTNTRGYIVYVDTAFFLVVSELDKKTHKIPRGVHEALPTTIQIGESELILSHIPITDSRLFSACREYVYDRERRSPAYA